MFDFGSANDGQRKAISTSEGPVLITAGPGTGKTYTLVQRAIYLIQECGVKPEQILMATFTEKAAKELVTRITNELAKKDIPVNVNEMYIGTFHSICLRIIKDNLEYSTLKKNYRLLDPFDQGYLVYRHIKEFKAIPNIEIIMDGDGERYISSWKLATTICKYAGTLSEELVDVDSMLKDKREEVSVLAQVLQLYNKITEEENLIDFSKIQTECYRILQENPSVLDSLREKICYLMIDEYQDTNYIQEQIVFLIGGEKKNICVVGDDDQGLYRFRGATIRNILEFPSKFGDGECKIIPLVVNYRSNSDIVDFYNEWMTTTDGARFEFSWGNFRYEKKIVPHEKSKLKSKAVARITAVYDEEEWQRKIYEFIRTLKDSGKITDYNQIAFLFRSVKNGKVVALANYLEENGINVYSPRSDMFFKRPEIMSAIGCLMMMMPFYVQSLEKGEFQFLSESYSVYYKACGKAAIDTMKMPEHKELKQFVFMRMKEHNTIAQAEHRSTDYAYLTLLYQLFAFKPFSSILDTDISSGVVDVRPARNLALLSQIIGKFEYLHRINVFTSEYLARNTETLFNTYLRLLIDGGIGEYEDDSEYAPSGCVSFSTIHQSKGMEFPIVVVDSLSSSPRTQNEQILSMVEEKYYHRPQYEPFADIKFFDFWRLYYTAFSRAQDLLVLTCNQTNRSPSLYFKDMYCELPEIGNQGVDLSEFSFHTVKDVNIKDTFSFTSHITVYETCSLQYKFFKELAFMPVRQGQMMFGTLVHETIEDIHKAATRGEEHLITPDNVERWFESNYASLVKSEHSYLGESQKKTALGQVQRYVDRQGGDWSAIKQAEVDVSLVRPEYIIEGKVDLIRGDNDTVELVDFKSEKKPDMEKDRERIEQYRRQLHIYAYLVEQRTGQKVSRMHLYYTGEENGNPKISFPYTKTAVEGTMSSFDDTVKKIMSRCFNKKAESRKSCENCDFRYYCDNK